MSATGQKVTHSPRLFRQRRRRQRPLAWTGCSVGAQRRQGLWRCSRNHSCGRI